MPRPVVIKAKKQRKFRNVKVECDGHVFDSKRELHHYHILRLRERIGEIHDLTLQPRFELRVDGVRVCTYVADFQFYEGERRIIVDVKSIPTRTRLYRLKIKLLKAVYRGIDHRELL